MSRPPPLASLRAQRGELALERARALDELGDLRRNVVLVGLHETRDFAQHGLVCVDDVERALPRHGLDAPHAGSDAALGDDLEQADVAGPADVRAAAELRREIAELQHAHLIAVLVAEKRERAGRDRFVVGQHANVGVVVQAHLLVDERLDLGELLGAHGLVVREIEAQAIRRDERALLLNVRAEHLAQRRMQQMRGGVIQHDRGAALRVDLRLHAVADRDAARDERSLMAERRAELLRVGDLESRGADGKLAGVADLAAAFRVERRALEHDGAFGAFLERLQPACRLRRAARRPARRSARVS